MPAVDQVSIAALARDAALATSGVRDLSSRNSDGIEVATYGPKRKVQGTVVARNGTTLGVRIHLVAHYGNLVSLSQRVRANVHNALTHAGCEPCEIDIYVDGLEEERERS